MNGRSPKQVKILFLAANPLDTTRLSLDEEIRSVTQKLRASQFRDEVLLIPVMASRPDDLLQALNEHSPQVVHFSGHGTQTDHILVDDGGHAKPVSGDALVALFKAVCDSVKVVVLNACYSEVQARAISSTVDCTIGMSKTIDDASAMIFAASFYRALAFGRPIKECFDQAVVALKLEGSVEARTPMLFARPGVDLSAVRLLGDLDQCEPPKLGGPWLTGSTLTLVSRSGLQARAFPLGSGPILQFDLTNTNAVDIRLARLSVDVLDFERIDIERVYMWPGAALQVRRYRCAVAAARGRYECRRLTPGDEYLRLSPGELEHFGVQLMCPAEGVYRLAVSIEYAALTHLDAADYSWQTVIVGIFDPAKHKVEYD